MSSLHCQSLAVSIGGQSIVDRLDLKMEPGQFWGLLGSNGSGKTTLMRHLCGLAPPQSGSIALDGTALDQWQPKARARRLGMMQQHTDYVFDASVLQVALTGRHPYLGAWQRQDKRDLELAQEAIASVELAGLEDRSVTSLSGGEARRLAFAALLVQEPNVMLLDEPTNHLDFRHQVKVMRKTGELVYGQQRLAVAALHDVNLAATYCSHVLMLFGDGTWQAGTATDLLVAKHLERLYQCPVTAVETPEGRRFHPSFSSMDS